MAIVAEHYADFGPTLAVEKLSEPHAIAAGKETLRGWMAADGLWTTCTERRERSPAQAAEGAVRRADPDRRPVPPDSDPVSMTDSWRAFCLIVRARTVCRE